MEHEELLRGMIELLAQEYGVTKVADEAERQLKVARVGRLVKVMGGDSNLKIQRIKVVWNMGFAGGLKSAKDWVETNFEDNGAGPPK